MRSITPIIAVVVLMLMTVAAAGMAFLTITTYQTETQFGTQSGIEQIGTRTQTQLRIESVSDGQIYLRNLGQETFSNPAFYVEGRPLNFSGPSDCEPGKLCVYTVLENVTCTGDCELSMGGDMPVGTSLVVEEEQVEGEGSSCGDSTCDAGEDCGSCPADCGCSAGNYCSVDTCTGCSTTCDNSCQDADCYGTDPDCDSGGNPTLECCGNGVCGGSETCSSCSSDCGTCPYTLKKEGSQPWSEGSNKFGNSIIAANLTLPKIIVIGDSDQGYNYAVVKIWNITSGIITLENRTEWVKYSDDTYGNDVFVSDVDNDGTTEVLTFSRLDGPSPRSAELRVWNYSQPLLLLENDTETGNEELGHKVYAEDVDSDSQKEIIGFSEVGTTNTGYLRIWNYTNFETNLEKGNSSYLGKASSVFAFDVDDDTDVEILTLSTKCQSICYEDPCCYESNMEIIHWNTTDLISENYTALGSSAGSVYAGDIDDDSQIEIVTAGTYWDGSQYNAHLIIWNFDGQVFSAELNYTNSSLGFNDMFVKDINGDDIFEIITVGGYGGTWDQGWVTLWNWNNTDLVLLDEYDLGTTNYVGSVYSFDVDNDGVDELLTMGANLTILNYTS